MHGGVSDTLVIVAALFAQAKPAPHTGQLTRATLLSLAASIPTSLLRKSHGPGFKGPAGTGFDQELITHKSSSNGNNWLNWSPLQSSAVIWDDKEKNYSANCPEMYALWLAHFIF